MNIVLINNLGQTISQVKHKDFVMPHFHSAVYRDWEDLTVSWGDTEVDDGSRVAFQNPSWFPKKKNRNIHVFVFLS